MLALQWRTISSRPGIRFIKYHKHMNHLHRTDTETLHPRYQPGTVVYSKGEPDVRLAVLRYTQGIYYCAVIGNAQHNNLPFLECQLEGGRSL